MNIKRIGLIGGGFTGNTGNLGSNIHIGTGDPNLDVSDGSIFIGTSVYIEHGFDTRNIFDGEGGAIEIINDLTTGGANRVLSAEMGKTLNTELIELKDEQNKMPEPSVDFRNLADPTLQTLGFVQSAQTIGSSVDIGDVNTNYRNTGYIPVESNTEYAISFDIGTITDSSVLVACFCDTNKKVIDTFYIKNQVYTTPIDCKYIIFTIKFGEGKEIKNIQVEKSSLITEFVPANYNHWGFDSLPIGLEKSVTEAKKIPKIVTAIKGTIYEGAVNGNSVKLFDNTVVSDGDIVTFEVDKTYSSGAIDLTDVKGTTLNTITFTNSCKKEVIIPNNFYQATTKCSPNFQSLIIILKNSVATFIHNLEIGLNSIDKYCIKKNSSVNLFNKDDSRIQVGKFINHTGIIDMSNCLITHPIFVKANTVMKSSYDDNFGISNRLMYIDNNQIVSATLEKDGDTRVAFLYQIPRDGFVLFNCWNTQKNTLMICIKDEFPNEYVPYSSKIEEGVDLSQQQKEYVESLIGNKADLIGEVGKNLFNKEDVINGYINSTTGILTPSGGKSSNLISIKAGEIYHISRPDIEYTGCVRFLDENGNIFKPLKLDGTEWTAFEPGMGDSGNSIFECKCKAPATAKYIQFTIIFNYSGTPYGNIENTQLEIGPDYTGYEPYSFKKVLPYIELPKELLEQLGNESSEERIINIENSDKIGVFSTSFMNGYSMRNHHHINNLSMFLDYIFYNYGHSGDDELENLDKLEQNLTWLGTVPPSKWNIKYGIVMHQENSGALRAANSDTIYENSKKLANAIKSLGGLPIFSTEHDVDYAYYQGAIQLCNEEGYMFMHWGTLAKKLFNTIFAPFWYNSHPATRTGWMITNGMLPYLQSLPRPTQCIKLFRVRESIDTTNLQNLVFEDLYTRAQRYIELTCGVSALTQATEKYFDRLDTTGKVFENVNDEYQYLQNKQAISFGNFAMINLILPYTKVGLKKLILYFSGTGVSNVYIQKIRQINNPLPVTRYVAFGITQGANLIQPGDTFTITEGVYNDNIKGNYIVSGIIDGMLITTTNSSGKTTSGTDTPIIISNNFDVSNVILSGSYDYPSYDYMSRYKQPLGEWIDVTSEQLEDRGFELTNYIDTCLNFDSVAILLKGTNISISDIFAKVIGSELKTIHNIPMIKRQKGESLITDSLLDNNTSWEGISDITNYDNTQTISTADSSYESLPIGITTVKEFQQGQFIKQSILSSVLNNNEYGEPIKIQIRVIARYFPKYIDNDTKWTTSEITEQSFDVARLAIYFGNTSTTTNPTKIAEFNVGAWWNEFIAETYCNNQNLSYIKAVCTDKKVQIAKIEVIKVI